MFPSNGPLTKASPSLPRVPQRAVPPARRYYETLRLPHARPTPLNDATRLPVPCACVRSHEPDAAARGQELCGRAAPTPALVDLETADLSSSWGILWCLCPVLRPRQDQRLQAVTKSPARPPLWKRRRLPRLVPFRGSIARLQHSLSTLRPPGCPGGRKTRCRCWPDSTARDFHPQDPCRKVSSMLLTSPPPFPGLP
jgi:hypothetical protein